MADISPGTLEPRVAESLPEHKRRIIMSTAERLRAEGRAEGEAKGRAEGRAASLSRLLAQRFGPLPASAQLRIRTADIDTLDRWLGRLLSAPDLDAVFE